MVGESGKRTFIFSIWKEVGWYWTWHSIAFHVRVGKSIFLLFDHSSLKVFILVFGTILSQMLPSQMSSHAYVQEFQLQLNLLCYLFLQLRRPSLIQSRITPNLFFKTWHVFHVVGPPTTGCFLLISTHYIGIWYRNLL